MRKNVLQLVFLLLLFVIPLSASAHLPHYVMNKNISLHNPSEITHPEISQVFYGELGGSDDYFQFRLKQPADILIGLLLPLDETSRPAIELIAQAGNIRSLAGPFDEVIFEQFGGDYYLKGPEKIFDLSADSYLIKVTNASSTGRYALVIGQKEKFSIGELSGAFIQLPLIKNNFFGKPVFALTFSILGSLFILLALALLRHKLKIAKRLLLAGLVLFITGSIFLFIDNPYNLQGILRIIIAIPAVILTLVAFYKSLYHRKSVQTAQYILWLLVLFETITMI